MNINIRFENPQEYFRMNGPWMADCYWGNKKLKHKFLDGNRAVSDDGHYVVLSRYLTPTVFEEDSPIEFNVLVLDTKTTTVYISNEVYESVFIESMKGRDITVFRAFHNSYSEYRESLRFSDQTFSIIDNAGFYES